VPGPGPISHPLAAGNGESKEGRRRGRAAHRLRGGSGASPAWRRCQPPSGSWRQARAALAPSFLDCAAAACTTAAAADSASVVAARRSGALIWSSRSCGRGRQGYAARPAGLCMTWLTSADAARTAPGMRGRRQCVLSPAPAAAPGAAACPLPPFKALCGVGARERGYGGESHEARAACPSATPRARGSR